MESFAQLRNHSGQVGCTRTQASRQPLRLALLNVGSKRFNERLIGQSERAFPIAMADEWCSIGRRDEPAQLIAQCGLAYAGLADQHDQCSDAPRGRLKGCLELLQLAVSADERPRLG
jgi:hypothetical protein